MISGYDILESLGRGATGEVFRAVQRQTGQTVALKVLRPEAVPDASHYRRLELLAASLRRVRHPHVAAVLDWGRTAEGAAFVAMEFAGGFSLGRRLRERAGISHRQCLEWLIQAARGLEAAWREGIIHRDVKPDNLMTTPEGAVKIVDFGLARSIRTAAPETAGPPLRGTPRYMSPEQALGRATDHRSDIYSLGAAFYHLLTGRPPFDAATAPDLAAEHIRSQLIPVAALNPAVPEGLARMIERMLEKDPDERHPDYESLIVEAQSCLLSEMVRARESGTRRIPSEGQNAQRQTPGSPVGVPDARSATVRLRRLLAGLPAGLLVAGIVMAVVLRLAGRPPAAPPQSALTTTFRKLLRSGQPASVPASEPSSPPSEP